MKHSVLLLVLAFGCGTETAATRDTESDLTDAGSFDFESRSNVLPSLVIEPEHDAVASEGSDETMPTDPSTERHETEPPSDDHSSTESTPPSESPPEGEANPETAPDVPEGLDCDEHYPGDEVYQPEINACSPAYNGCNRDGTLESAVQCAGQDSVRCHTCVTNVVDNCLARACAVQRGIYRCCLEAACGEAFEPGCTEACGAYQIPLDECEEENGAQCLRESYVCGYNSPRPPFDQGYEEIRPFPENFVPQRSTDNEIPAREGDLGRGLPL